MGYRKAEDILPVEIIQLIQQYIDGTNIYIPRKQDNRQNWGNQTAYKQELKHRNEQIYRSYLSGMSVCKLAQSYYLSEKSIRRIIRQEKVFSVS